MDLSIIIPCHNLENFIQPLLSTLKYQVFAPYKVELIFVLDHCTDNTARVLMDFQAGQYEQIKLINTDVRSCGLARNVGLDHCEGEYIWFVDGDDWLTGNDVVQTIMDKVKGKEIIRFGFEALNFHLPNYPSMVWQYCLKRSLIGDLRFDAIQPHEDVRFMGTLLCDLKDPIYKLDKVLYHYNYMREGSNIYQFRTKGFIEP